MARVSRGDETDAGFRKNVDLTTKLTCRGGPESYEPRKAYVPPRSGAAPGSVGDFVASVRPSRSFYVAFPELAAPPVPVHPVGRSVERLG